VGRWGGGGRRNFQCHALSVAVSTWMLAGPAPQQHSQQQGDLYLGRAQPGSVGRHTGRTHPPPCTSHTYTCAQVQDVTERCAMLTLLGPEAEVVLKEIAGVGGAGRPVLVLFQASILHGILTRLSALCLCQNSITSVSCHVMSCHPPCMSPVQLHNSNALGPAVVVQDTLKVLGQPYGSHEMVGFKGGPLIVISGGGLSGE
jgi:hypothetical protein